MSTAQSGIFALGSPSHAYLEFDLQQGKDARALIEAMSDVREPRTTIGGVNFVSGFRPELWRSVVPEGLPGDLTGFNQNLTGPDGYVMPATQHDAVLRSEEHTSELQSRFDLVCRLLLEKKN